MISDSFGYSVTSESAKDRANSVSRESMSARPRESGGDRRFGKPKEVGDIDRGNSADDAQGEGDLLHLGQNRMTGHVNEVEPGSYRIHCGAVSVDGHAAGIGIGRLFRKEQRKLGPQNRVAPQGVDGDPSSAGRRPRAKIVDHLTSGKTLMRSQECPLRAVFSEFKVAERAESVPDNSGPLSGEPFPEGCSEVRSHFTILAATSHIPDMSTIDRTSM